MASITEINRQHFDARAHSYDAHVAHQNTFERLTQEIRDKRDWIGVDFLADDAEENAGENETSRKSVRLLDYACGTGLVSRALAPYVSELRGIDISPNMVREYNTHAANQGLSPTEMFSTAGDLLDPSGPSASICGPEFFDFDLAVVGMGFHHFEKPKLALERLLERVKPKIGVLLIIDFLPHAPLNKTEDHTDAHHKFGSEHTVAHNGFAQEEMLDMLEGAGCRDVKYLVLGTGFVWGPDSQKQERKLFMCRGTRAS